jgi:hypothetical protein
MWGVFLYWMQTAYVMCTWQATQGRILCSDSYQCSMKTKILYRTFGFLKNATCFWQGLLISKPINFLRFWKRIVEALALHNGKVTIWCAILYWGWWWSDCKWRVLLDTHFVTCSWWHYVILSYQELVSKNIVFSAKCCSDPNQPWTCSAV